MITNPLHFIWLFEIIDIKNCCLEIFGGIMADLSGMAGRLHVCVPATTTNLGPGFDCVGMALTLYNELTLEVTQEGLEIVMEGEGVGRLSCDANNLAYRAVAHVFHMAGRKLPGLCIALKNRIPVERGLGSSAAALAGGMVAANRLLGDPFSLEALMEWAAAWEGHPDNVVPAFMGGWTVVCQDRDRLRYIRLDPPEGLRIVAAVPVDETSTQTARQVLPEKVPFVDAVFNVGRTGLLVAALASGQYHLLSTATQDRLHQPYRQSLNPGMEQAICAAWEAGALGACLSGSGSTVIALAENNVGAIARAMQKAFESVGLACQTWVLSPSAQGVTLD